MWDTSDTIMDRMLFEDGEFIKILVDPSLE
jgi:hypothetical protein